MKDDIKTQDAQLAEQLANMSRAQEHQKTGLMGNLCWSNFLLISP